MGRPRPEWPGAKWRRESRLRFQRWPQRAAEGEEGLELGFVVQGEAGEFAFEEVADLAAIVDPVGDVVEIEVGDLHIGQADGGRGDGEVGELGGQLWV